MWIRGLFLEGAGWDKKNACLIEAEPMQLVSAMPTIHFKPVENKKKSGKGTIHVNYSELRLPCYIVIKVSNYLMHQYEEPLRCSVPLLKSEFVNIYRLHCILFIGIRLIL